jgi:Zn-finger nucleic acid-binding protein
MNCPVDDTTLTMADRQGVEIDYCPTCRGVWLDRGELDKIIERADSGGGDRYDRDRDRGYGDDDWRERRYDDDYRHGKRRKKRGFLSDMFEFDD